MNMCIQMIKEFQCTKHRVNAFMTRWSQFPLIFLIILLFISFLYKTKQNANKQEIFGLGLFILSFITVFVSDLMKDLQKSTEEELIVVNVSADWDIVESIYDLRFSHVEKSLLYSKHFGLD